MNIRFLETFVWLAKLQSIRLTAEKLHATRAAISSRIASLESMAGGPLFDRHSQTLVLTAAGKTLLGYAERIVALEQQMHLTASGRSGTAKVLRVGVTDVFLHGWFPVLVNLAHAHDARLDIRVVCDSAAQLTQMLEADALDLVLHPEQPLGGDYINLDLGPLPLAWVASPRLQLSGRALTVRDLSSYQWVGGAQFTGLHKTLESALAARLDHVPAIHSVHSLLSISRLIQEGFGIGILPMLLIEHDVQDGLLDVLDVVDAIAPLRALASYRASSDATVTEFAALAHQTAREIGVVAAPFDRDRPVVSELLSASYRTSVGATS